MHGGLKRDVAGEEFAGVNDQSILDGRISKLENKSKPPPGAIQQLCPIVAHMSTLTLLNEASTSET